MSDIVRPIEPFHLTQEFGENPHLYAKFGLKGHNGWDFRTKWTKEYRDGARKLIIKATPYGKRPILAPCYIQHYRTAVDPNGYGDFYEGITQLYSTWKLTFGHCSDILKWSEKNEAEIMAISGSTGNSTGDHVHLTVKRIKIVNGKHQVIDHGNGYYGAVNPQQFFNELRKWLKEKGKVPTVTVKENNMPTMKIEKELFEKIRDNSESFDFITDFLGLKRNENKDIVAKKLGELKHKVELKDSDIKKIKDEHAKEIKLINDSFNLVRNEAITKALAEKGAVVNKAIAEALEVGPSEDFADLLFMIKRLKDQSELPSEENSSVLEDLLDKNGYKVDSYTVKKK